MITITANRSRTKSYVDTEILSEIQIVCPNGLYLIFAVEVRGDNWEVNKALHRSDLNRGVCHRYVKLYISISRHCKKQSRGKLVLGSWCLLVRCTNKHLFVLLTTEAGGVVCYHHLLTPHSSVLDSSE